MISEKGGFHREDHVAGAAGKTHLIDKREGERWGVRRGDRGVGGVVREGMVIGEREGVISEREEMYGSRV